MSRKKRNPAPKAAIKLGTKVGAKIGAKTGAKAVPYLGQAMMVIDAAPVLIEGTIDSYSRAGKQGMQALREVRGKQYRQATRTALRAGGRAVVDQAKTISRAAVAALSSKEAMEAMTKRNPKIRKNGPTLDRPSYPFAEKESYYAKYTDDQLAYALADAKQAYEQEEKLARAGHWLAQHGWYADDVHTIAAEIRRRKTRKNTRTRKNGVLTGALLAGGAFLGGAYAEREFGVTRGLGKLVASASAKRKPAAKPAPKVEAVDRSTEPAWVRGRYGNSRKIEGKMYAAAKSKYDNVYLLDLISEKGPGIRLGEYKTLAAAKKAAEQDAKTRPNPRRKATKQAKGRKR